MVTKEPSTGVSSQTSSSRDHSLLDGRSTRPSQRQRLLSFHGSYGRICKSLSWCRQWQGSWWWRRKSCNCEPTLHRCRDLLELSAGDVAKSLDEQALELRLVAPAVLGGAHLQRAHQSLQLRLGEGAQVVALLLEQLERISRHLPVRVRLRRRLLRLLLLLDQRARDVLAAEVSAPRLAQAAPTDRKLATPRCCRALPSLPRLCLAMNMARCASPTPCGATCLARLTAEPMRWPSPQHLHRAPDFRNRTRETACCAMMRGRWPMSSPRCSVLCLCCSLTSRGAELRFAAAWRAPQPLSFDPG